MADPTPAIATHYTRGNLGDIILGALRDAGLDPDDLAPDDLAPLDEFHIRGREATRELAEMAALGPDVHVLDVGCGIGGPSRYLAAAFGCRVTGLDLTPEFCDVAALLSARTGLAHLVEYREGDALEMPFADASYDVVWTQHASMNIPDKPRLYGELFRVCTPGGKLALYDVVRGAAGEPHYPVPWARDPAISFLLPADEVRAGLETAGFRVGTWRDVTAESLAWFRDRVRLAAGGAVPALGLHVVMGADWGMLAGNMVRNLEEGRIAVVQGLLERPV